MKRRNISERQVNQVLQSPDQKIQLTATKVVYQSIISSPTKPKELFTPYIC
jgi:hypothetical protein